MIDKKDEWVVGWMDAWVWGWIDGNSSIERLRDGWVSWQIDINSWIAR